MYTTIPLAAAAALRDDDAWAARIIGARDAVIDRTGVTVVDDSVRDLRDGATTPVVAVPLQGHDMPAVR